MTRRMLLLRLLGLWGFVIPYTLLLVAFLITCFTHPEMGLQPRVIGCFLLAAGLLPTIVASVDWVHEYRRWKREHP